MIKVSFPDGNTNEFKKWTKVIDVAKSISEGLARKVISASYNFFKEAECDDHSENILPAITQ